MLITTLMKKTSNTAVRKPSAPAAQPEKGGKYQVPVVRSTFRILEELVGSEPLGLKEVTAKTGIAKSTVFRILSTLVHMGYVVRDANRNYHVSPAMSRLANEDASGETLRSLALPYMLELRNTYRETVNLGTQHFDSVRYLEVVPSEFALRLQESRGASVPAHASALGKAILAFSPSSVLEQFVHGYPLESITSNTITRPEELLTELKRVRSAGFAFDHGEGSLLATCVGAPILDAQGNALAAMSISGPASRFNPKKDAPVIASLLKATAEIGRALARSDH